MYRNNNQDRREDRNRTARPSQDKMIKLQIIRRQRTRRGSIIYWTHEILWKRLFIDITNTRS